MEAMIDPRAARSERRAGFAQYGGRRLQTAAAVGARPKRRWSTVRVGEGAQGLVFPYVEAHDAGTVCGRCLSLWLDLLVLRLMNDGTAGRSRYGSSSTNWPACNGCRS